MKYLNTSHLELLGSYGSSITSANGYIKTSTASSLEANEFTIGFPPNSNMLYFSVNYPYNGGGQIGAISLGINRASANQAYIIFSFGDNDGARIKRVSSITSSFPGTQTDLWVGSAPIVNDERLIHVRVNVSARTLDMYVNGTLVAESVAYNITGAISNLVFGKQAGAVTGEMQFNNFIISDSPFPPTERVVEVSPTITTTDWTVANDVATTNTVGDEMTLTVPSGAIDESAVKLTGYTVGLLDSAPSEDVNAVAITQGSTTDTVTLPSGSTQSAYFTVSQASAISASVVARSVTV